MSVVLTVTDVSDLEDISMWLQTQTSALRQTKELTAKKKRGRGLQHSCWTCKKSHCNATNYSLHKNEAFVIISPVINWQWQNNYCHLYVARMNRYFFYRKKRLFRNIRWVPIPFDVRWWLNLPLLGLSFLLANQLDLNSIMRLNRRPLSSSSTESLPAV